MVYIIQSAHILNFRRLSIGENELSPVTRSQFKPWPTPRCRDSLNAGLIAFDELSIKARADAVQSWQAPGERSLQLLHSLLGPSA